MIQIYDAFYYYANKLLKKIIKSLFAQFNFNLYICSIQITKTNIMTTKEIETLKETVISLLLENTTLKKKLQSSTESYMFWYEKHEDLKKEINSKN